MRNPKFRIWNKVDKKWEVEGFSLIGETMLLQGFPISRLNDLEVNQFTELHDKRGVEIYEGDIVRLYGGDIGEVCFQTRGGFVITHYNEKSRSGWTRNLYDQIHFPGPSISLSADGKISGEKYYTKRKAEVIGNIYENKKLLEDK